MKKKLALLGTLVLVVSLLAGCGDKKVENINELKKEEYVTLGEYKGLPVTAPSLEVNPEEEEKLTIQIYNQYNMQFVTKENGGITEGTVKDGDFVNIDYVGKKGDVAFEGGTAQNQQLGIGTKKYIDGFETGLIGVNVGETVDLNLTFPENYGNPELDGQDVVFTVTVNYIYPELKDEIVASWGEETYKNVDELKAYIHDYLETMAKSNYDYTIENSVLGQFMEKCTFNKDIPEGVISKYRVRMMESIQAEAANYNMDAEGYCQAAYGMILSEYLDLYAVETAKQVLAMLALAEKEGLVKTGEALDAAIRQAATDAGFATVEEFMGDHTRDDYQEAFAFEDALKFLVENASVTVQ